MSKFSNFEKLVEIRRELAMRQNVYARKNAGSPLTAAQERQIAILEDIAVDYSALVRDDENDLFS